MSVERGLRPANRAPSNTQANSRYQTANRKQAADNRQPVPRATGNPLTNSRLRDRFTTMGFGVHGFDIQQLRAEQGEREQRREDGAMGEKRRGEEQKRAEEGAREQRAERGEGIRSNSYRGGHMMDAWWEEEQVGNLGDLQWQWEEKGEESMGDARWAREQERNMTRAMMQARRVGMSGVRQSWVPTLPPSPAPPPPFPFHHIYKEPPSQHQLYSYPYTFATVSVVTSSTS
jgi:hypothetical protein